MKLILLEGVPGSGKTTTTKNISAYLESKGFTVKDYIEGQGDNPIGQRYTKDSAFEILTNFSLKDYPFDSWSNLEKDYDYLIVDSRFLQNICFAAMLSNYDKNEIAAMPLRILKSLSTEVTPYLVYFNHSNPREHIVKTVKERNIRIPEWFDWIESIFSKCPWVVERKLSDAEVYFQPIINWHDFQESFVPNLPMKKLLIRDPSNDWNESLEKIYSYVLA